MPVEIRTLTPDLKREFLARRLRVLLKQLRKGLDVQSSDVIRLLTFCSDSAEPPVSHEQGNRAGAGAGSNCTSPGHSTSRSPETQ
jgi:hypothetical protein